MTKLNYGGNAAAKYPTYYFRHEFMVDDPSSYLSITMGVIRDDGAVVYLNGVEIFRSNMPSGVISYATLASTTVNGVDESTVYEMDLDPGKLVAGTNLFAVEVHQSAPDSSDVSFNLQLLGLRPQQVIAQPPLSVALSGSGLLLSWPDQGRFALESTSELSESIQWETVDLTIGLNNGRREVSIPLSETRRFYRLNGQ